MPTNLPTAKQQQVLDFVDGYIKEWGSSPSFAQIGNELGINRGTVRNHLRALEVRGLVVWNANEAHSIQVKK